MRKAELHELFLPTKYEIWYKYIYGTELQNIIGTKNFIELLNQRSAIELVNQKGVILCKTLNEKLIHDTVQDLYQKPYQSVWSLWFSKLVKLIS